MILLASLTEFMFLKYYTQQLLTAYFSLEHTWNIPHDESYAGKM
jgi:hypothetical protein